MSNSIKNIVGISQCKICSNLKSNYSANLLMGEELPKSVLKFEGMEEAYSGRTFDKYVKCPYCGTFYVYSEETGGMEWDAYISRLSPDEALFANLINEQKHKEILQILKKELNNDKSILKEYAAHSVMVHYLNTGNDKEINKLLKIKDEDVLNSLLRTLHANTNNFDKYLNLLLNLCYHTNGKLRDAALAFFKVYNKDDTIVRKYCKKIVRYDKNKKILYSSVMLFYNISRCCLDLTDISPFVDKMLRHYSTSNDFLWGEPAILSENYVKYSKNNARFFVDLYENIVKKSNNEEFKNDLKPVYRLAKKLSKPD